jgi:hypothetical protein
MVSRNFKGLRLILSSAAFGKSPHDHALLSLHTSSFSISMTSNKAYQRFLVSYIRNLSLTVSRMEARSRLDRAVLNLNVKESKEVFLRFL